MKEWKMKDLGGGTVEGDEEGAHTVQRKVETLGREGTQLKKRWKSQNELLETRLSSKQM